MWSLNFCLSCIYTSSFPHVPAPVLPFWYILLTTTHHILAWKTLWPQRSKPFRPKTYSLLCILSLIQLSQPQHNRRLSPRWLFRLPVCVSHSLLPISFSQAVLASHSLCTGISTPASIRASSLKPMGARFLSGQSTLAVLPRGVFGCRSPKNPPVWVIWAFSAWKLALCLYGRKRSREEGMKKG